jgi:low affinity Fe/Cu permease
MNDAFRKFAVAASKAAGSPWAFIAAIASILVGVVTGHLFRWSETHLLSTNTGMSVVSYVMLFLVANAQNRDSRALHIKIDELLRSLSEARNRLIGLEDATDRDLNEIQAELRHRCDDE